MCLSNFIAAHGHGLPFIRCGRAPGTVPARTVLPSPPPPIVNTRRARRTDVPALRWRARGLRPAPDSEPRPFGVDPSGPVGPARSACPKNSAWQWTVLLVSSPYHGVLAIKGGTRVARWRPAAPPTACAAPCGQRFRAASSAQPEIVTNEKSHACLEQHGRIDGGTTSDIGVILLDRRLPPSLGQHAATGCALGRVAFRSQLNSGRRYPK